MWNEFGIDPEEYEDLPWWKQDLIAEGLAEKYSDGKDPGQEPPGEASLDDLAALGVPVRRAN